MSRDKVQEVLERVTRMETRLMKFFTFMGFEGQGKRPEFVDGKLHLPSPDCSLKDCLDAVPADWNDAVEVYVGEDYLTTLD